MRRCDRRHFLATAAVASLNVAMGMRGAEASSANPIVLSDLEARHGGRIGLSAKGGNGFITWRSGERFPYCSTFKVFLAACVLERVQKGLERLDRSIPISRADMVPHAPITGSAVGSSLTAEQLMKAAVEVSDNPAANLLIREIGGLQALKAWYNSIGDTFTRADRMEVGLNSAVPGDPRDTTSSDQFALNLERVLLGQLLSEPHRELLLQWLIETPTGTGRIRAALPTGYRIGHKTGTGGHNTCNDMGIIWPPSGAPVLMVVFYTGARDASPGQLDGVVAEASRRALAALGYV